MILHPQHSQPPTRARLSAVAADLVAAHGWDDPQRARGQCGIATWDLRLALPALGHIRAWSDPALHGWGRALPEHPQWEHNAARHGRTVIDVTARQFDRDVPAVWIVDLDEWADWVAEYLDPSYGVIIEMYSPADVLRRSWRWY